MAKSRLLMKEQPIVIDKGLAKVIGLNEAIVLQQIEYWTNIKEVSDTKKNRTINENFVDGYYWTYNTVEEWSKEFPFWSYDTVKRTLTKLRNKNLVVTGTYNKKGYDRTLWYRVNHEELIKLENDNSAKCPNEENSDFDKEKTSEPLKIDNSAKCPNAKVQNAPMQKCKMPQPIPKITTKTSTKISTSSSSKSNLEELIELFEEICELKKTTKPKFLNYCNNYNGDFVKAVIEYCIDIKINSYAGFETVIKAYIEKDIVTANAFINSVEMYREEKKEKYNKKSKNANTGTKSTGSKELKFNNFEARKHSDRYDYLREQCLLGQATEEEKREFDEMKE